MVPVGHVEAILRCTRCLETYRQIAPVVLFEAPAIPWLPWITIMTPHIELDRPQVDAWASAHLGPIILDHYHTLEMP